MKVGARWFLSVVLVMLGTVMLQAQVSAQSEECPNYNFQNLFFSEYFPGTKWDNSSGNLNITWSANNEFIQNDKVIRPFSSDELVWIRDAFQSWDDALSTVTFSEVASSSQAAITIGYVDLVAPANDSGSYAYWNANWTNNLRYSATIKLKTNEAWWFGVKSQFIQAVQHEIGNVLGLGDVISGNDYSSTLLHPWQPPYGNIPLSNFDTGIVRQLYGESTCPSTFPSNIKAAADLKAKQEADAIAAAKKATEIKKSTITCVKGKITKRVTASKSVCPIGYKKK